MRIPKHAGRDADQMTLGIEQAAALRLTLWLCIQTSSVLRGREQSLHATCCLCFLAIKRVQLVVDLASDDAGLSLFNNSLIFLQTRFVLLGV